MGSETFVARDPEGAMASVTPEEQPPTMPRPTESRTIDLLLIVFDEALLADMASFFSRRGYQVALGRDGEQALDLINRQTFDVTILDTSVSAPSGLELLRRLKDHGAECEFVMLTAEATGGPAVEAIQLGVSEALAKPVRLEELDHLVRKAYEARQLRKENRQLKAVLDRQHISPKIIGNSPGIREVIRFIDRVGPTNEPVLIRGESGTGRDLAASALHQASRTAHKPLVAVHCAESSETCLESELFGHEKGALADAGSAKPGLFEVADGGTLFIDGIDALTSSLQAKLLRVLEEGTVRRAGSAKLRKATVRLISATNRDISREAEASRFREDLFYRINVLSIDLPPLRQRRGDIELLIKHICGEDWMVAKEVLCALKQYSWPGNVRQLRAAIRRAMILADDHIIRLEHLPPGIVAGNAARDGAEPDISLDQLNKRHIVEMLKRYHGNKARTAQALGIGRRTLYRLLDKYDINDIA